MSREMRGHDFFKFTMLRRLIFRRPGEGGREDIVCGAAKRLKGRRSNQRRHPVVSLRGDANTTPASVLMAVNPLCLISNRHYIFPSFIIHSPTTVFLSRLFQVQVQSVLRVLFYHYFCSRLSQASGTRLVFLLSCQSTPT